MKTVELAAGIRSSVLGFGCAPILGSIGASASRRALELAMSSGINHLDLARSYGYGEAERFVGRIIQGRRHDLVLASKFGIAANWKSKILKPVKPIVRLARGSWAKGLYDQVDDEKRSPANNFHDRVPFKSSFMRKSLESSLRALRTNYLDYFFIHEPVLRLDHIDELAGMAEILKAEGKIRAWGLAFMRSQETLHADYLHRFDILQFDNSPGSERYGECLDRRSSEPNIIFSPLRGGTGELSPTEKIKMLFNDFPKSVVLCSMFSEQHLKQNIESANSL